MVADLAATSSPSSVEGPEDRIDRLQRLVEQLIRERDEYKHLAELLQRELERLRDLAKTPREHVDPAQIQLAFEALTKQLLETAAAQEQASAEPPAAPAEPPAAPAQPEDGKGGENPPKKRTPHGRSVLPEHLPIRTLIITPADLSENAVPINEEVTWRLGTLPTRYFRLKVVRPIFAVPRGEVTQVQETKAILHEGDISLMDRGSLAHSPVADAASSAREDNTTEAPKLATPAAVADTEAPRVAPASIEPLESNAGTEVSCNGSIAKTTIICAPAPDEMIPRGLPTPELLAQVLTNKFADKLPFNRQEGILARSGVRITRGTMCGWAEHAHSLACLVVDAMCCEAKSSNHFIATDATGVLVQANEKCKRGHFWVFVADRDHVFFRYSARHSSDEPKLFLSGFKGTVIADASNVYDALFRLPDGPKEAGCNAHARRYFYKALVTDRDRALVGVGFFNKLFELERTFADLPPSKRLAKRKEHSAPVVDNLEKWRDEQLQAPDVAEGTPIRRALQYLVNHWVALTQFLRDGKIPIHNNWSELELRRLVVGRANWLFVGSDESAERTCTFVSLVASCELHGLDPQAYLRDLFRILPSWPRLRVLELAPKYWAMTRARLDPAELALPLGPLKIPPPLPPAKKAAQHADASQDAVAHAE